LAQREGNLVKRFSTVILIGLLLCLGCYEKEGMPAANNLHNTSVAMQTAQNGWPAYKAAARAGGGGAPQEQAAAAFGSRGAAEAAGADVREEKPAITRRIKYTADIRLVVEDFGPAVSSLLGRVASDQGYVAHSEISGSAGAPRSGSWTMRIPVDRFQAFVEAVNKLGVPQRSVTDSEELTAQYVDLEARLSNKKKQEETMRGYLQDKKVTSQLKDILTVEQELVRVRGEVEQLQGQLRLVANVTDLATATIRIDEVKNYVPPQTPTFATTVAHTFSDSCNNLLTIGKAVVLVGVALAPWLPLIAFGAFAGWLTLRRVLAWLRPAAAATSAGA
jgi:hypothetical protein